ncbi:hypothetical protein QBC35DRAFT_494952 [Podospora australis]|uniref:Aminoacyl-transfer RNA synthetases class-II family profile domain-containing protein n=1 Tax=Podospora australis TaxID=1536484 RepID=A0AAN6WV81_9PEZI|nr:hypothetical protein QBC35DRAFT_494952 [Podospora australis]
MYLKTNRVPIENGSDKANGHRSTTFDARVHEPVDRTAGGSAPMAFLLRRTDGQFKKALLVPGLTDAPSLDVAWNLTTESLVRVSGDFVTEEGLQVTKLVLLSKATVGDQTPGNLRELHGTPGSGELPLLPAIDERLDNRLLDARVAATSSIFKLFSGIHELAVEFLAKHDFYHTPTPALVAYEFPGEEDDLFSVGYFGKTARLAPTGEIHLGMALSADLERVYDFHTVFRREPASDGRHLTEFTMLELVFHIRNDWNELLDFADILLVHLVRSLQEREKYTRLTRTAKRLYPRADTFKLGLDSNHKLLRVKFNEAKAILRDSLGLQNTNDQEDLSRQEEAALGRFLASEQSHLAPPTDVFFVTHFPRHLRPCNIAPNSEDETTQSFDVILRGQEVVTGCRLLHSAQDLRAAFAAREHPIDPDSPEWRPYLIAHEIGMPPWGGFGLGINRLVQGFLGLDDIRETVLFPRDAARLTP